MTLSKVGARPLWAVLVLYTLLALAYNWAQPPFEPSDEQYQFGYIQYLIENQSLPVAQAGELSGYHHPPLYFALAAILAAPFPTPDLAEYESRINPYARYRHWEPSVDNKNLYLHGAWDSWPLQNTALAVHLTRVISLLFGWVTITFTYQLAKTLFDADVALGAAGLLAFTPMFTSLSGALQNDLGATAMGALLLWLTIRAAQTGFSVRSAGLLGIVGGVGVLMKLTALSLLPPVAGLIAFYGWRAKKLPGVWPLLAAFGFGLALTTGWWFARNFAVYGDATALNINLENFDGRTSVWEGVLLWPEMLPYAWTTFWGRIGHGGIVLYDWMYQALGVMVGIAGLGWWRIRHKFNLSVAFLLAAGLLAFLGLMFYITLSPTGANGRYAYSALPAYMVLLAAGLLALFPERVRRRASFTLVGGMMIFSTSVLAFFVLPAYTPPPRVTQLPAEATPLNANLGDTARVLGFQISSPEAKAGDRVYVTIYWEPLSLTDRPYSVYLHLLAGEKLIAQRDTYPGLGRAATTTWQVGSIFADKYLVIIPEEVPNTNAVWKVGLWQAETGDYAYLLDEGGQPIDSGVQFGEIKLITP